MSLILIACSNEPHQSKPSGNPDYEYYQDIVPNTEKVLEKFGIVLTEKEGFLVIFNAAQCEDCARAGVDKMLGAISRMNTIDHIFLTGHSDYIERRLGELGFNNSTVTVDTERYLFKQGFDYPRQLIIRYTGHSYSVYRIIH